MNSSGTVTYIHHDHHGSVIAQSGSSGAVGNKYKYGPFGESAALTGTTIGYTGRERNSNRSLDVRSVLSLNILDNQSKTG